MGTLLLHLIYLHVQHVAPTESQKHSHQIQPRSHSASGVFPLLYLLTFHDVDIVHNPLLNPSLFFLPALYPVMSHGSAGAYLQATSWTVHQNITGTNTDMRTCKMHSNQGHETGRELSTIHQAIMMHNFLMLILIN